MSVSIFIVLVTLAIVLLGRYTISEGQRKKSQRKFIKNMNEFDSKKNKI